MDPPPSARAATQAVEARPQGLRGNAPTRTVTVGGRSGRLPRTTLVASRRQASSGRPYHPLLRPTGSAQTCRLTSTFRTAGCGPACPVVWQGSSGAPLPPMPIHGIVQALFEDGVLQRNGAVKLARSMNAVKVPATVQAVLAARIDRLPAKG